MVDKKLSELTSKAVPEGTDLAYLATADGSRKSTLTQIFDAMGGSVVGTTFVYGEINGISKILRMTQVQYDAIAVPDPNTLYIIVP